MGLLDEAIREHLELKRRRGADPTEIERLEREALGPVRRLPEEQAASAEASDELSDLGHDEVADDGWQEDEFAYEHEDGLAEAAVPSSPPESEEQIAADLALEHGHVHPGHGHGGPETSEYDVEAEHREEEQAAAGGHLPPEGADLPGQSAGRTAQEVDDDMLEETPEFLQDTPEHDRLWFEQGAPKDFDFDG